MQDPRSIAGAVSDSVRAYVGLGANLGDVRAQLLSALKALAALPETRVMQVSSLYQSAPIEADGPDYLNAVAELQTSLGPQDLLTQLQTIEKNGGRERSHRNAPRTLDLDLLLYGSQVIQDATLTVPHPRLHERAFVLQPLAEIAPDAVVPQRGAARNLLSAVAHQRIEKMGALTPSIL